MFWKGIRNCTRLQKRNKGWKAGVNFILRTFQEPRKEGEDMKKICVKGHEKQRQNEQEKDKYA